MSTSTMNISLPEALKRFVKERTKTANYSNPSDYVRSLIREDQRRQAAERLFGDLLAKHLTTHPATSPEKVALLRADFWTRWNDLKSEIDKGLASLDRGEGRELNPGIADDVKRRGRERLAASKAV